MNTWIADSSGNGKYRPVLLPPTPHSFEPRTVIYDREIDYLFAVIQEIRRVSDGALAYAPACTMLRSLGFILADRLYEDTQRPAQPPQPSTDPFEDPPPTS